MATRKKAGRYGSGVPEGEHRKYNVHHDRKVALKELLHESIYADLLIIDSKGNPYPLHEETLPTVLYATCWPKCNAR